VSPGAAALPFAGARPWAFAGAGLSVPRMRMRAFRREADPAAGEATDASPVAPAIAEDRAPELVAACVRGDEAARREFVVQYDGLIRYAMLVVLRQRNVVLNHDELEDLHQVVLASFFDRNCRRLQMYEGRNQATFATFLRVCATRQTLDHLRHRRRRPPQVEEAELAQDPGASLAEHADPGAGPEETTATRQALLQVREVVAGLPPREQLLVRLHFVEGLEIPGVARALGISENATHVLKSRIRAKLRAALEPASDG
jgi:RNA polymerase sigma factor (sigma-70 family)